MLAGLVNSFKKYRLERYAIVGCVCLLSFSACEKASPKAPSGESHISLRQETLQARAAISPAALGYLEAALDTIQALHPIGPDHDWEEWRLVVLERARGAQASLDTYEAIKFALADLPGGHASFVEPSSEDPTYTTGLPRQPADITSSISSIHAELLRDHIGAITLPAFLSADGQSVSAYASRVQQLIRAIDHYDPCGWIIDLRGNGGGNMWPMILGIGPVLGEGQVGAVATPEGATGKWYYINGETRLDSVVLASLENPYKTRRPGLPAAVLIGRNTGSSGEAVAIAFQGRPTTRFFGTPTAGATSSPVFVQLEDGAVIGFAGAFMADRNGVIYTGPIQPDVNVQGEYWDEPDHVLEAAIQWLEERSECRTTH